MDPTGEICWCYQKHISFLHLERKRIFLLELILTFDKYCITITPCSSFPVDPLPDPSLTHHSLTHPLILCCGNALEVAFLWWFLLGVIYFFTKPKPPTTKHPRGKQNGPPKSRTFPPNKPKKLPQSNKKENPPRRWREIFGRIGIPSNLINLGWERSADLFCQLGPLS